MKFTRVRTLAIPVVFLKLNQNLYDRYLNHWPFWHITYLKSNSPFLYSHVFISARQEEEDQERNQDLGEPSWRTQHHQPTGNRQRPCGEYST